MGLFTGLFSSKTHEKPSGKREIVFLMGLGDFEMGLTGEEHFQAALEAICGPRVPRGVNRFETAWLIWEDKAPGDKNAVRVEIRGKQVGYLSREATTLFSQHLLARGKPNANGQCQAAIRGGWVSSDGRKGPYCVALDIPSL